MKGIYPFLSYTTLIAIGFVVLTLLLIFVFDLTTNIEEKHILSQLDYTAGYVKGEILKLYAANAEGKFKLSVPETIANKKYTIGLDQNNLTVKLILRNKPIEVTRTIKINATLTGLSYLPASIEMEKLSDGNILIRLI